MEDTFFLNIVHRPELSPEYAASLAAQGAEPDRAQTKTSDESLDIFVLQQQIAHKNGLRTTIQMTYASLFSAEAVALAKADHETYGDEIALTLLGLPCEEFTDKYQTKDFCIWMFSAEDKRRIVDDVFGKFFDVFGFYPASTGSYYMDADLIGYIKGKYPSVVAAVATCFEEGPKAYHTCNNSWYTFMDGGPWAPWIPSTANTHAPAANAEEDAGVVAIPHLSRDLIACYDGNGSNFGTHPQNVLRGMIYQDGEYPYLYNLIDQYRHLGSLNNGLSYNMVFVGPGWMNRRGRWEAPYELLVKSYEDCMAYYGALKKQGRLTDVTMQEFAGIYRANKRYGEAECALWRDILYGSEKQYFWYCDPNMRAAFDMNQGGALIDLRPYAAKLVRPCGIGTKHVQDASYPFLIQMNYRAGYFTHYAGEGTIKSCKVSYAGQEADLCLTRTKAHFARDGRTCRITLDPVEIVLGALTLWVQTEISMTEGESRIRFTRTVTQSSDEKAAVAFTEYVTACYGTTEYPEDMTGVVLTAESGAQRERIDYAYRCREARISGNARLDAVFPEIHTRMTVTAEDAAEGFVREGYAFSPMATLGISKKIAGKGAFRSWLSLSRED